MLNVEEPVVPRLDLARFGAPALRSRIRRIDTEIHDLGNVQTPLADERKARAVPVGVRDEVDRHLDVEGSGKLQRLEILAEGDALAVLLQAFFVDRLNA